MKKTYDIGNKLADIIETTAKDNFEYKMALEKKKRLDSRKNNINCENLEKIFEEQQSIVNSASNISKDIIRLTPNTSMTGPVRNASPSNFSYEITGSHIVSENSEYQTVSGYTRSDGTFVHQYQRAYPGETPIPKNHNNKYPKTQPSEW